MAASTPTGCPRQIFQGSGGTAPPALIASLEAAGFERPSVAGRLAPAEIRSFEVGEPDGESGSAPADDFVFGSDEAPDSVPVEGTEAGLVVKTVGLHVGGGARSEASRQQWVRIFERHFDAFARCHALASQRTHNASFGIDIYVPVGGGPGGIGEVRTRLRGKGFRGCMLRAFRAIEFPPPGKGQRTAVSYSLIFKPPGAGTEGR